MKRAMGTNLKLKHDYLMASSMWPLKNNFIFPDYYFLNDQDTLIDIVFEKPDSFANHTK